jgi:peptide/nickel transport system ATP-binding protein
MPPSVTPLLEIRNLRKRFPVISGFFQRTQGYVQAVEDVSFDLHSGETLGLVGESGCGKTTVGRAIIRLIEPTSGSVHFLGEDILQKSSSSLQSWRQKAQMIFQDPFSSLNPRMKVSEIVGEGMKIHSLVSLQDLSDRVQDLLEIVGLDPETSDRFPHEFSGGQRQRIGIARALALNPQFIVADEPVSALDVSIQAQIVNLLLQLQEKRNLSYLFISHDLRIVEFVAHRVLIMYLGRMMELLPAALLRTKSCHPYTKALLSAVPVPDPFQKRNRMILSGDVPNPSSVPSGCVFHPRCPMAQKICATESPVLRKGGSHHWVACHLV